MRKYLWLSCLCVGGFIWVGTACGDDDSKPKDTVPGGNGPGGNGPGGNGPGGNGPGDTEPGGSVELLPLEDYIAACNSMAKAAVRAEFCCQDEPPGGSCVPEDPEGNLLLEAEYQQALADYVQDCEELTLEEISAGNFLCAQPNFEALETCMGELDAAEGCTELGETFENSEACGLICPKGA